MALKPALQSSEEPVHKTMQVYTDTLCTRLGESNLTMTMLQDIPTFDGQDSSKLEDWFMDIETATDILTNSHTHAWLRPNHIASPTHSSTRPSKQDGAGVTLRPIWQSASLLRNFKMHQLLHLKYIRRIPKLWLKSSKLLRNSVQYTN